MGGQAGGRALQCKQAAAAAFQRTFAGERLAGACCACVPDFLLCAVLLASIAAAFPAAEERLEALAGLLGPVGDVGRAVCFSVCCTFRGVPCCCLAGTNLLRDLLAFVKG